MLNYVVTTLTMNLKESERNKTTKLIEMKQTKPVKEPRYGYCGHCGQYLPWFCVCYLNKKN